MFQNISREAENSNFQQKDVKLNKTEMLKGIVQKTFTKQNIVLYIIALMASSINFGGESLGLAPFGLAILAAALSNGIPIIGIYISTLIGTTIGFGPSGLLTYLLTSFVFFATVFLIKGQAYDDINEKKRLGKNVCIATLLVQIVPLLFTTFYLYDFIIGILMSITVLIFYKIFVNPLSVITELGVKKVFAIEEVIGASLLIAIAFSALEPIQILGFSVKNILCILVVMILGWKNGLLVGATGGITIGIVLGIIGDENPIMVAAYALSGMISGIFNKFGKVGVIAGFILGNCMLTYVANGNVVPVIMFQEILLASLGLLAIPKKAEFAIEDLFIQSKMLPVSTGTRLEENKNTVYKLNSISEAISEMAQSYAEAAATVVEEEDVAVEENKNKKIFVSELKNNLDGQEENILYEDVYNNEDIITDIFKQLLKSEIITKKSLIKIFENHNNYIIGFEVSEEQENEKLYNNFSNEYLERKNGKASRNDIVEKDISKMIKIINHSYKISKINFIWTKKIEENNKNVSNQLQGVSDAIANLAEEINPKEIDEFESEKQQIMMLLAQKEIIIKDISIKKESTGRYFVNLYTNVCENIDGTQCEIKKIGQILSKVLKEKMVIQNQRCGLRLNEDTCMFNYISNDVYNLQIGIARSTKAGSPVSGDTSIQTKLADGKYLLAISDGMGSGPEARKSSKIAIKMLERLLSSGFNKENSISLINSTLSANNDEDMYATLDAQILDLYAGTAEFVKNGACPSYIKRNKSVELIKSTSIPTGMITDIDLKIHDMELQNGDILIMCSDGVIESNSEFLNKELWVKYVLEEIQTDDVQKIADMLISEAIDNDYGKEKDDMTVIVAKVYKV